MLVSYFSSVTAAFHIAETSVVGAGENSGNTTVGSYLYLVAGTPAPVGHDVYHTGSFGGTTHGVLEKTCVVVGPTNVGTGVTCTNIGSMKALEGDSGGPVYWYSATLQYPYVVPEGIEWGSAQETVYVTHLGQYVTHSVTLYSPLSAIESDLGATMNPATVQ